jgi:hypothetical protein
MHRASTGSIGALFAFAGGVLPSRSDIDFNPLLVWDNCTTSGMTAIN